jgi:hypothetical protein
LPPPKLAKQNREGFSSFLHFFPSFLYMFFFLFVHVFPATELFFLFYFAAMENFDFTGVLNFWIGSYYTIPLMHILSIAVIIAALKSKPQTTALKILTLLTGASLLQALVDQTITSYAPLKGEISITVLSISAYIIIELTCCFFLVSLSGINLAQKRSMQITLMLFYLFEIIYISFGFSKRHYNSLESIVEFSCIIFFCTVYYYNILSKKPQKYLLKTPLFWAISGMAFMALVQMPCAVIVDYILFKKSPYSNLYHLITAVVYCTLFISFLKAIHLTTKNTAPHV